MMAHFLTERRHGLSRSDSPRHLGADAQRAWLLRNHRRGSLSRNCTRGRPAVHTPLRVTSADPQGLEGSREPVDDIGLGKKVVVVQVTSVNLVRIRPIRVNHHSEDDLLCCLVPETEHLPRRDRHRSGPSQACTWSQVPVSIHIRYVEVPAKPLPIIFQIPVGSGIPNLSSPETPPADPLGA